MSSERHCPGSSPAGNYYSGAPVPDTAVALVNPEFESSDRDQAVATALVACSDRKGFLTCFTILVFGEAVGYPGVIAEYQLSLYELLYRKPLVTTP